MFARNVCFSRSERQDPRLMYPFPGAIGRFGIHGARILPPRPPFRVERPEITHSAKNLPALPGFSAAADRSLAERALRPAPMPGSIAVGAGPCHLARTATRVPRPSRTLRGLRHLRSCSANRALRPRRSHRCRYPRCRLHRCRRIPPPVFRARHPRPIPPQTSGTARATQCGHKNGIPERGSH